MSTPAADDGPKILVGHVDGDPADLPPGMIAHTSRPHDAPPRVNRQPEVLGDVELIEATRQASECEVDELCVSALAAVREGGWVSLEHRDALKRAPDRALRELQTIMHDGAVEVVVRARAAKLLIELGAETGEQFLFAALDAPSADLRAAAVKTLGDWELYTVDFAKPERAERILSLCDDANAAVASAATELATHRQVPGAEERLTALLASGAARNPTETAYRLAEVATSQRAVEVLLPHVFQEPPLKYRRMHGFTFRRPLANPDPAIAEPVRKALHAHLLQYESQRYDQSLVRDLARTADSPSIVVLRDIAAQAKDVQSQKYAIEALARLQPEQAVALWLQHILEVGPREDLLRSLAPYASAADFDRVVPFLLKFYDERPRPLDLACVQLLLERFGERGQAVVRERFDSLEEHARMWAMWKLKGLDLAMALTDLHAAGVIGMPPAELIEKMRAARAAADAKPVDLSDPHELTSALGWARLIVAFDVETGTIPCDHHRLAEQFADATQGKLDLKWPLQIWHREHEEDFDAPYTVQFVAVGRLFRVGAENYGDWYDVEAVLRLMNFALAAVQLKERFIALEPSGQVASFVFADPDAFCPLAAKYGLPLAADPAKAMRLGIEFEQHVIGQLKAQ